MPPDPLDHAHPERIKTLPTTLYRKRAFDSEGNFENMSFKDFKRPKLKPSGFCRAQVLLFFQLFPGKRQCPRTAAFQRKKMIDNASKLSVFIDI